MATRWGARLGVAAILVIALVVVTGRWAYQSMRADAIEAASSRLETLRDLRQSTLRYSLQGLRSEALLYSGLDVVTDTLEAFAAAWRASELDPQTRLRHRYVVANPHPSHARDQLEDPGDGSEYSRIHAVRHLNVRRFRDHHNFADVLFIDVDGDVVYTTRKADDFATNLLAGPFKDTALADVFRTAVASRAADVAFADFTHYPPSDGPAAFIASPVLNGDTVIGVLAFRLRVEEVNEIMRFRSGMGDTGETYLVGEDGLMRSNSRFSEESTILRTRVDTDSVARALHGETGVAEVLDYREEPVLSAFEPLEFEGVTWAVIAEVDVAEVLEPVEERRRRFVILELLIVATVVAGALYVFAATRA